MVDFPKNNGPEREKFILNEVIRGNVSIKWSPIESTFKDNKATFFVFSDALAINGVRVNVSAETEQKIADQLGCLLLTAKLADLIFKQAEIKVEPKFMPIDSSTKAMIAHSAMVDKSVNGQTGLISTTGKHWIVDNLLNNKQIGTACNYGWHFRKAIPGIKGDLPVSYADMPGIRMIQSRGTFHNLRHTDYSQVCVLVARECEVNGETKDLAEVLKDPVLSYLANISGPMKVIRQPGVPESNIHIIIPDIIKA